jgi:phage terminase small subunit
VAELNERQKKFCEEYLACKFNGTQAAINAGYSKKTAYSIACENLKKPEIQNYLSELVTVASKAAGIDISKERTLREIGRISFSDIRKLYTEVGALKNITDIDEDTAAALAGVETTEEFDWVDGQKIFAGFTKKVKTYDKTKGLEMLAKIHKMYSDAPIQNNTNQPFSDDQVEKIINALKSNATKGT